MSGKVTHLTLPLSRNIADELELGQIVTVSGTLFTGRSRFHIRAVEDGMVPDIDYDEINCFFHVGPVMRRGATGWEVVSIEPTSSIRFERYGGSVVRRLNLRTLIGKTTMGPGTAAALKEVHGVHLSKIGICGNQLASCVKRVEDVFFLEELGKTEATWILEVGRFGPFFVDIDAHGRNYFDELDRDMRRNLDEVYAELGIPEDYEYTNVDAGGA